MFTTLAQVSVSPLSVDDVLSPYIYVFYAAFLISFFFTPVMRVVATYYGIIDEPDNLRKIHREPVAYLGGVAVFLGWVTGLAVSQFLSLHRTEVYVTNPHVIIKFSIVIGAAVILTLGLWDDVKGIKPVVKVGGQVLAALFLLAEGVGTLASRPLLEPAMNKVEFLVWGTTTSMLTPDWVIYTTSAMLTIAIVVACCNAMNLMDGLDGLCGGVTAIIAAGFAFLAIHLATSGGGLAINADALRIVLSLALLGAVLGFIPYNFNPASIFMGDTGSMLLGFASATMIILLAEERAKWFLAALVMFALPVLDTALAFTRRYVNGRPVFSADKFHFHHQLLARGLSVRQAVLISYGLAIGFVLLGAAIVFMRTRYAIAVYLVVFGSIIVAAFKMGMVHERTLVVTRKPLGSEGIESGHSAVELGGVIDVRDAAPVTGSPDPGTVAAGAWEQDRPA